MESYIKKTPFVLFVYLILLLSVWFSSVLIENRQYIDDSHQTSLREMDDYNFQKHLYRINLDLDNGNLKNVFTSFRVGYGSLWWSSMALVSRVFKGNISSQLFYTRFLSQLFTVLCLILLYMSFKKISPLVGVLVPSLLIFTRTLNIYSTLMHNHGSLMFLSALLLYVATLPTDKKTTYLTFIISGLGIGVKLSFLPVALYFSVLSMFHYYKVSLDGKFRTMSVPVLLLILATLFSISPNNVFIAEIPQNLEGFWVAIKNASPIFKYPRRLLSLNEIYNVMSEVFQRFYGIDIFLVLISAVLLVINFMRHGLKKNIYELLYSGGVVGCLMFLLYLYRCGYRAVHISAYIMPLGSIILFIIYEVIKENDFKRRLVFIVLISAYLLSGYNIFFREHGLIYSKYSSPRRHENDHFKEKLIVKSRLFIKKIGPEKLSFFFTEVKLPSLFKFTDPYSSKEFIRMLQTDIINSSKRGGCVLLTYSRYITIDKLENVTKLYSDKTGGIALIGGGCDVLNIPKGIP